MTMIHIVLGTGFGDEGKGATTARLGRLYDNPLVVRFNGGQQAGHTVVRGDKRHVFSSFGSGTLDHVPTFWSRFCTFNPRLFLNERDLIVQEHDIEPIIYVDPLSPVTTPYDILLNQKRSHIEKEHHDIQATVGVGFGVTLERQEKYYKLHVNDLRNEDVLRLKLQSIAKYYLEYHSIIITEEETETFVSHCVEALQYIQIVSANKIASSHSNLIFEGAQGILLDQDHGFFPFVTRSKTTSNNAFILMNEMGLVATKVVVNNVIRTYCTRHGSGPFPVLSNELKLINAEKETNVYNDFQGQFRIGHWDPKIIEHAINCDIADAARLYNKRYQRVLHVTCLDQTPDIDAESLITPNLSAMLTNIHYYDKPE